MSGVRVGQVEVGVSLYTLGGVEYTSHGGSDDDEAQDRGREDDSLTETERI